VTVDVVDGVKVVFMRSRGRLSRATLEGGRGYEDDSKEQEMIGSIEQTILSLSYWCVLRDGEHNSLGGGERYVVSDM